MNTYYCKCGRVVNKNTNADNTGNRDVENCAGCPYLMPWGENEYINGRGFQLKVKGYECRMSRSLEYASRFSGNVSDKCVCAVISLDYDFLEQISDWIRQNYPNGELSGFFSREYVRSTDFSSNGRYRYPICCAPNKAGVAAKAALLEHFFNSDGSRKDIIPDEEEKKIKHLIESEKQAAQGVAAKSEQTTDAPEKAPVPTACLCTSCTCSGCKPECFGHCQGCGDPTTECNAYQTEGEKFLPEEPVTLDKAIDLPEPPDQLPPGDALATMTEALPAFDYSGLDAETATHLQNLARRALESKQRYYLDMMEIVYEAHQELVPPWDKRSNQYSESTFRAWCASIGVSKTAAYRLLQVQALMDNSTPEEQETLEKLPAKAIYEIARPSTPAEAVAAAKSGDITSLKEYKELMEQLKAEQAAREAAEQKAQDAQAREEEARATAHQYLVEKEDFQAQRNAMIDRETDWAKRVADAQAAQRNAEQDRDAARDMLEKAKRRANHLVQERDDALEHLDAVNSEMDELRARPIEVAVAEPDPAEIERLAEEKAEHIAAQRTALLEAQMDELARKNLENSRREWSIASSDYDMIVFAAQTIENAWLQAAPAWQRMEQNVRDTLYGNLERAICGIQQALETRRGMREAVEEAPKEGKAAPAPCA